MKCSSFYGEKKPFPLIHSCWEESELSSDSNDNEECVTQQNIDSGTRVENSNKYTIQFPNVMQLNKS